MGDIKQVIVIRKDLNMRKGKIAAQAAHASMKIFFDRMKVMNYHSPLKVIYNLEVPDVAALWIEGIFKKICVYVNSEQELIDIYQKAQAGIMSALIQDAGLTEFNGVLTYTCCCLGPDYSEKIDKITGELPLL